MSKHYKIIEQLVADSGTGKRHNCPVCYRQGTLSVNKEGGTLLWHCYGSGCSMNGKRNVEMSIDDFNAAPVAEVKPDFSRFVPVSGRPHVIEYLKKYYVPGTNIEVKYDVAQDRVVFIQGDQAIGRALTPGVSPKWYRYTKSKAPMLVQYKKHSKSSVLVLVEDVTSAAAVSHVTDSLALLGTNFYDEHLNYIKDYDTIAVALDKDAITKSIEIHANLSLYKTCIVIPLERDLKCLDSQAIELLLRGMSCKI